MAAGGSARAACWGELFSAAARARGARGTLIDGYCRDARRIAALGYPVWCRGTLPLDCKGRTAVTAWRQPAVVGGLQVRPGDLVVADDDGAVVIPAGAHRGDHPPGPGQGIEGARAAGRAGGGQHAAELPMTGSASCEPQPRSPGRTKIRLLRTSTSPSRHLRPVTQDAEENARTRRSNLKPASGRLRCNRRGCFVCFSLRPWMHYLNSVSAADLVHSPLSLLF